MEEDYAVVIPAGTKHNVINIGASDLKLYSIYSPPEHKDGTVHKTKADVAEEHFDDLFHLADKALYKAKKDGKNMIVKAGGLKK